MCPKATSMVDDASPLNYSSGRQSGTQTELCAGLGGIVNPYHAKDEALPARLPVETGDNEHDCGPCGHARALINTHTSSAPSEHSFVARHWTI